MKRMVWIFAVVLVLGTGCLADNFSGTTYYAQFNDTVDWCQFGCAGASYATPQAWVSAGGATGLVGLSGTGQNFFNAQQGSSWFGNFANGMGLVYNGAFYGNTPTGIAATFDAAVNGVGAYIQANFYGAFTATITLYDSSYQQLFSYTANGFSDGNEGTALFIGAIGDPSIWAVQFDVVDQFGVEDFSIGTMELGSSVPEPSSLILFGTSVFGLAGAVRRRLKGVF